MECGRSSWISTLAINYPLSHHGTIDKSMSESPWVIAETKWYAGFESQLITWLACCVLKYDLESSPRLHFEEVTGYHCTCCQVVAKSIKWITATLIWTILQTGVFNFFVIINLSNYTCSTSLSICNQKARWQQTEVMYRVNWHLSSLTSFELQRVVWDLTLPDSWRWRARDALVCRRRWKFCV